MTTANDDAVARIGETWERYRAVGSEREELELLLISQPSAEPYTRPQVDAWIRETPSGMIHKRAVRHILYAGDGRDKVHILFSLPTVDAGLGYLVRLQADGAPDEMSLFMPGYRKVRRVALSNRHRLAGTDLLFEDVRSLLGERRAQFDYVSLGEKTVDGRQCVGIEATPKTSAASIYSKRRVWIDPEWNLPLLVEYYDGDKVWKVLRNSDVHEAQPGVWRAGLSEMRDLVAKHVTLVRIAKRDLGLAIRDEVFTPDYLMHPGSD